MWLFWFQNSFQILKNPKKNKKDTFYSKNWKNPKNVYLKAGSGQIDFFLFFDPPKCACSDAPTLTLLMWWWCLYFCNLWAVESALQEFSWILVTITMIREVKNVQNLWFCRILGVMMVFLVNIPSFSWKRFKLKQSVTPFSAHLLTWKWFKLKQSVTPYFDSKFDSKSNGDIHLELRAPKGALRHNSN